MVDMVHAVKGDHTLLDVTVRPFLQEARQGEGATKGDMTALSPEDTPW